MKGMKVKTLAVDLAKQTLLSVLLRGQNYRTNDAEALINALERFVEAKIAQERYSLLGATPQLPRGTDRALTG
jgi:hypothetical protein